MDTTPELSPREYEMRTCSAQLPIRYRAGDILSPSELIPRVAFSSPIRPYQPGHSNADIFADSARRIEYDSFHSSPSHVQPTYSPSASGGLGVCRTAFPPPKMAEFPPPQAGFEQPGNVFYYGGTMPATLRELTETSIADEWEACTKSTDLSFTAPTSLTEHSSPSKSMKNESLMSVQFSTDATGRDAPTHWIVIRGAEPAEIRTGLVSDTIRKVFIPSYSYCQV